MHRADTFVLKLVKSKVDPDKVLEQRGLSGSGKVQQFIDTECLRLCNTHFVPFDQHTLIESSIINTVIGSGELKYRTPYARKLYYHPEYNFSTEHNAEAGGYWFERMKQQYKEQILSGAKRLAGAK